MYMYVNKYTYIINHTPWILHIIMYRVSQQILIFFVLSLTQGLELSFQIWSTLTYVNVLGHNMYEF